MTKTITDIKTINIIKSYLETHKKYRELLFFLLSINTGLNCTELLDLNISDVLNKDYIVASKKDAEIKRFPINQEIQELIKVVANNRPVQDPLFISIFKTRIDRSGIFRCFKSIFKEIGLSSEYSVSSFRKTFGYHYYQKTKDLAYLQWVFNQQTVKQAMDFIGISEDMNLRLVPVEL